MKKSAMTVAFAIFAYLGAVVASGSASGAYPDRPIRLVVSFPAGGSSDAVARIVQQSVEKQLGQPIVIENRPGAGGVLGIDLVAKAPPDGYLIGLGGAGALGVNLGLQEKPLYDPRKDLKPVTGLASVPFILAASPSLRGKSLRDIIGLAKGSNQQLAIGHGGNGTMMHLTGEMFNQSAGIKIDLVPYRGIAPVVNDLIGGHIELGIVDPPSAMSAIESGLITTIAVSSAQRFSRLPTIPTFAESGLPDFESIGWFGIVAPAGTPADVIAKLSKAFVTALAEPGVVEKIRALGSVPMPMTPDEFQAFIASETSKWEKVVAWSARKEN
ncbi:tripartite tricarboxylate transporter substrate binding protein [Bradyrhizobium manausense]|uniref:Bug family tripartite tricarboxylate transporter substrate binding protein n=1 Tax=Bradyrhizobium manausense TaxID=989370 RepID=UPI001BAC8EF6|nr:tripartite tricarboxylate transporter substrate binding protein [Bradyrhizobium manausense]MBR0687770.1 tripartite tricarboxylate transporter substrate binding protein [Bradyrhizobium manausense]